MPFRREHERGLRELKREQPFRRLIPNLITLAGLCCGLSAIRFAILGRWEVAVGFILAAALIDGLDGRAARLLRATSVFGAQLDSLSDFVCFGVAPAIVIYIWQLHDIRGIGWAITLFFAICTALRLARFNTALTENTQASWQKQFFTGVPAPAGGILGLLPLVLALQFGEDATLPDIIIVLHMLIIALLMVSRIPTFAAKNVRMPPHWILPVTIVCVLLIVMLIIEPWLWVSVLSTAYLASIPFSIRWYRSLKRAQQLEEENPGGI